MTATMETREVDNQGTQLPFGPVVKVEPATYIQKGERGDGKEYTLTTAEKLTFANGTVRYRCIRCGSNSKLYEQALSIRPHGAVHRNELSNVTPPMPQVKRGRPVKHRLAPQIEEYLLAQIDGAVKDATEDLTQERDAWKARALDSESKLAKLRAALTSL